LYNIKICQESLSSDECVSFVVHPGAGGIVTFVGTVRNLTDGKSVRKLSFEAYEPMALKEMNKIAQQISNKWSAFKVAIHHRVGELDISDIAVIISVSTPHRKAAFEACQYAIDTLKETVPIWKKEYFDDGEVWVSAHP